VKYEWDESKNRVNIRKHGIDFLDVPSMFQHPMVTFLDQRKEYGEERWIGIGILKTILAVVVFAEPQEGTIRIISVRKATKHEERIYRDEI
jgi:uncharacterized DUF497 family protein